jgi:hypothetical protein
MELEAKTSKTRFNGRNTMRTYSRTWEEIENMLGEAELVKNNWRCRFEDAKVEKDSRTMKDAARNYKALEGVEKTLRWVLGERGVETPLQ